MLHPVGNLPARVYWRRRLVFVGLPLLGIILLLWAALSGGGDHPSARTAASTTTNPANSAPATTAQPQDSGSIGVSTTTPTPTTTPAAPSTKVTTAAATSTPARKGFCTAAGLTVVADTAKKSFAVKSKPVLSMLVTNTTAASCKLDAADKNVEWRVYTGDARVWGSNDCSVKSGSNVVTLAAGQAIRLSISWSGLTSAPKCAGTRLAVQTGTYRLYAYLDGKVSPPLTFTISNASAPA